MNTQPFFLQNTMSAPYVAPYGGLLTRTLDEEKDREAKIKEQEVEVRVNDHTETIRPEALHIRGVDSLATDDLKSFIDYYVNYEEVDDPEAPYQERSEDRKITFRIQWVNDTSVNVIFKDHADSRAALSALSITLANPNASVAPSDEPNGFSQEYLSDIVQERETKSYSHSIKFHKAQKKLKLIRENDLFANKDVEKPADDAGMDEDESAAILYIRQAFHSDRKVKNAAAYSRYYLLHGEPERRPKDRYRQRESKPTSGRGNRLRSRPSGDDDLFAHKLGSSSSNGNDGEDDLFASKMRTRERSPVRDRSRSPMRD